MLSSRGRNALPPPWLQTEKHCHVTHQRLAPIAWFVFWKQSLFGVLAWHWLTFLSCFLQSRHLHSRYGLLLPVIRPWRWPQFVVRTPFLVLVSSLVGCRALLGLGLLGPSDGKRNTCDIVVSARFLLLIAWQIGLPECLRCWQDFNLVLLFNLESIPS